MRYDTLFAVGAGVAAFLATTVTGRSGDVPRNDKDEETIALSPFTVNAGGLGATPGGFQDINYGRSLLEWGLLPTVAEITPEGLFSEYDLPTPMATAARRRLVITGDAKAAGILNRPDVTHLAQLGFASGLDASTWQRDPVFLVVVADVSGSMEGNLSLLRDSVRTILDQLGPQDAFALVSFSDEARMECAPTRATSDRHAALEAAIGQLGIRGGTNIEAGLDLGFALARTEINGFAGRTRVVLITDAMPNLGATQPGSFMAQVEAASLAGTGLTTIGVGLQFSADFVKQVSSVSGGNAFYFADAGQMQEKLEEDFDFMVTELAFDIEIRVEPAPGIQLLDVYGLPGDLYTRTPGGGLLLDLATLFLSRERGAIFLSFAGEPTASPGTVLGHASLRYTVAGASDLERSDFALVVRPESQAGLGLQRGELLINEYETLRAASRALYEQGDVRTAARQARTLSALWASADDPALAREKELIENLTLFLSLAERTPAVHVDLLREQPESSPLVGVWRLVEPQQPTALYRPSDYVVFLPDGKAGFVNQGQQYGMTVVPWRGRQLGNGEGPGVTLAVENAHLVYRAVDRSSGKRASWRLERCSPAAPWRPGESAAAGSSGNHGAYYAATTLMGDRAETPLADLPLCLDIIDVDEVVVADDSETSKE